MGGAFFMPAPDLARPHDQTDPRVTPNVSNKSRFDVKIKVVGPGVYE
jgi:hypothetical protein